MTSNFQRSKTTCKQTIRFTCRIKTRRKNSDLLVDLDTDGTLGNVPDSTSAAVVELMGHTLMDGAVHLDVDIVTDLVGAQVGGQWNVALLAERP